MIQVKRDQVTGITLIALGIVIFLFIQKFSYPFSFSYPGPKMLPGIAAFGFCVCGLGIFIESSISKKVQKQFLLKMGWLRLGICIALLCCYVLLMKYFGYLAVTPVITYIIVTLFARGKKTKILNRCIFSVVFTIVVYVIYVHMFNMPFPHGILF